MSCAKMAEAIKMPFGYGSYGPKES